MSGRLALLKDNSQANTTWHSSVKVKAVGHQQTFCLLRFKTSEQIN